MNVFIESLNQWSVGLLAIAWQMLWQSSLLIGALFVFEIVMRRKVRAAVRYALWLVVLLKLVIPPTFAVPTSVAWWLRPSPLPLQVKEPKHYVVSYSDLAPTEQEPDLANAFTSGARQLSPVLSWSGYGLLFSAGCSICLLSWAIFRWRHVTRLVRDAWPADESLSQLLEEAGLSVGVQHRVQLRVTDRSMSPAVCGLFRPVILLPRSLVANIPATQLRAVLLHELIHLKRGDVWINCLQTLLQIVYWWHPLVWLANARIRRVREEAVDDAVMLALRDDADSYAPTLLEVAKLAFHRPLASLGLVGILESRSALRQRIERLIDFQMPRRAGLSFVSLLGIAAFTAVAVPMGEAPQKATTIEPQKDQAAILVQPENRIVATNTHVLPLETNLPRRLPVLNPLARTNLINTSPARQAIVNKLDQIRFDKIAYDGVPLSEVTRQLSKEIKLRATDGKGINFMINASQAAQPVAIDSATNETDIMNVQVTINPPLTNILARDLLDEIVEAADKPIKYSIKDFAIEFSWKGNEAPPLSSRRFKVDTNALNQKFEATTGHDLAFVARKSGSTDIYGMSRVQAEVIAWCKTLGVNLDPPKSVFFNEREGTLWVRATTEDLDRIEAAIQNLTVAPSQINIRVKFVELTKELADAFWQSHPHTNTFIRLNQTAFSYAVISSKEKSGFIKALQNGNGVEELSDSQITMLSARQAQLQTVAKKSVVVGMTNGYPVTEEMSFGPIIDVVPFVQEDGYTIQMTLIPSVTEFLGYEAAGTTSLLRVPGKNGAPPEIVPVAGGSGNLVPRFRLREMTITTAILDGQTVILGHFRQQDWFGKNRETPITYTQEDPRRNLLVFITPTILDTAGNRVHTDEELDVLPAIKR